MNKVEKFIYDIVKSNPGIKNLVRNVYQATFDLLPKKKDFFLNHLDVKKGYFFGFHDLSPFSEDESKLLANKPTVFLRMPKPGESLEVGYFKLEGGKIGDYVSCSVSKAWNHHKGCRLQWLSKEELIFNTSQSGKMLSIIYNIETQREQVIDFPIDTVHPQSRKATSFSYERLEKLMPGYGYPYEDNESFLNENNPMSTGLFLVDLDQNLRRLLVSLKTLVDDLKDASLVSFRHYVTHSEFSNDGRYISFLHRWIGDDVKKRWSRLVIYDLENNSFFSLPTSGMVSHYVWNNNNQIIAYCSVNGKDGHVLFDIPNVASFKFIGQTVLNSDGHQSFIDNKTFITDTYPDKYRTAKIYKVSIETGSIKQLVSVYSPKKYQTRDPFKHIACDLHPRVSPSGKYVCFDTAFTGIRSLAIMKIID